MRVPTLLLVFGCVFFAAGIGHAQSTVVEQQWVSVSAALAGHADIRGTNAPAEGITVELCSPDWHKVLASTKTDKHGYFSLEEPESGKLFYLRLSAPGVNPYQLRVRVNKHSKKELTVHLNVAT